MPRFLIEAPHDTEPWACAHAVQIFLNAGSHFLTHADWGCKDGEHKAWITVEAENKDEARSVLPPVFRSRARITGLNRFSLGEVEEILAYHHR